MAKLPYFKWYPAEAETDSLYRLMTFAERGFYLSCLNMAWINQGLPSDPNDRARLLGCSREEADALWVRVSAAFPVEIDGKLLNPRQEQERAEAIDKGTKAQAAAHRKHANAHANAHANVDTLAVPRAYESVSVSESVFESEVFKEKKDVALTISESPTPLDVLDELQPIYISAGAPIPGRHSQMILQQLMGLDGKGRQRVLNYVKWALYSGKWPTPAKTKALRSVLADGDWDVEITTEMLQRARAPGNGNSREDRVLEMYNRMQEAANGD